MFCRNCGKHNNDSNRFCEECGAPLKPLSPDSGMMPEKGESSFMNWFVRVNWIGIAGCALAVASVCTGTAFIELTVTALIVSIIGLCQMAGRRLNIFAIAGFGISVFALSVISFIMFGIIALFVLLCRCIFGPLNETKS